MGCSMVKEDAMPAILEYRKDLENVAYMLKCEMEDVGEIPVREFYRAYERGDFSFDFVLQRKMFDHMRIRCFVPQKALEKLVYRDKILYVNPDDGQYYRTYRDITMSIDSKTFDEYAAAYGQAGCPECIWVRQERVNEIDGTNYVTQCYRVVRIRVNTDARSVSFLWWEPNTLITRVALLTEPSGEQEIVMMREWGLDAVEMYQQDVFEIAKKLRCHKKASPMCINPRGFYWLRRHGYFDLPTADGAWKLLKAKFGDGFDFKKDEDDILKSQIKIADMIRKHVFPFERYKEAREHMIYNDVLEDCSEETFNEFVDTFKEAGCPEYVFVSDIKNHIQYGCIYAVKVEIDPDWYRCETYNPTETHYIQFRFIGKFYSINDIVLYHEKKNDG